MAVNKLMEKIPDIYFDWYARLLPGAIGIALFFHMSNSTPTISASYLVLYAIIAYVSGHVVQPAASMIVGLLQLAIKTDEDTYAKAKADPNNQNLVDKVSKAHAEAVGMLSTAMILLAISVYFGSWPTLNIFFVIYCMTASLERSFSRKRKIKDLPQIT